MNISSEGKFFIGILLSSLLILIIGVLFMLRPPALYERSQLLPSDTITMGVNNAAVYLVEFSDFQCPACKAFKPIIEQIIKKYGSRIQFGYRHFPLPQHKEAQYAARAFEAANEQGKAWEMYDFLFANQSDLSESVIAKGVIALGLDKKQFDTAIASRKIKDTIERDVVDGSSLGINSTPTFFLNGKKLNLFSADDLLKAVDAEMAISNR
jgi:protein-disulfide isomerase